MRDGSRDCTMHVGLGEGEGDRSGVRGALCRAMSSSGTRDELEFHQPLDALRGGLTIVGYLAVENRQGCLGLAAAFEQLVAPSLQERDPVVRAVLGSQ
jgi:hypothetical protein